MTTVIPFQITVGGRGAAGYGLQAAGAGRVAEARLVLPALPGDPAALGRALGQALFPAPVRQLLIDVARGADEAGARLQLQLSVAPPELAALPWEWASLGEGTPWRPAVRDDYALVRVGRAARPVPPLAVAGPIRLLLACAPGAAAAAAAPLGHALAGPVRAGALVVDLLRDSDATSLRSALHEEPCHALHLVLADATGQGPAARLRLGRGLDAAGLVGLLEDHRDLRLLTLAADPGAEPGALASVAAAVHDALGIAAVALGDLDHAQAAAFCGPCYAAIAAGEPADLAVTDGRAALEAAGGAWGAPRLWAVPGGERLFTEAPGLPAPQAATRRPLDPDDPELPAAPVGTPLRPSRAASAIGRSATRALATARSFVVDATAVGEPAQRARPDGPRPGLLQPKLVTLIVACLILIFMVSRVLPDGAAGTAAEPTLAPTADLFLPTPMPTFPATPNAGP